VDADYAVQVTWAPLILTTQIRCGALPRADISTFHQQPLDGLQDLLDGRA